MQQQSECDFFIKKNRSINYINYSDFGFLLYPFKHTSHLIINSNLIDIPPSYTLWIPEKYSNDVIEICSVEYSLIKTKSKIFPDTICLIRMTPFIDSILRYYKEQKETSFYDSLQEINLKQVLLDQLRILNCSKNLLPTICNTHLNFILQAALTKKINKKNTLDIENKLNMQNKKLVEYWHKEMDMSLNDVLIQLKIKDAILKFNEDLSLARISKDLGYGSISGFSNMFKCCTGTTPYIFKTEILSLFN